MKLRPLSYLILGMVRLGATSGYAIKKAADASTREFWPTSLAQVYPELRRLEQAGLLERRENPSGGRARATYRMTAQGDSALGQWLRSTKEAPTQLRDEGMLRLFFADALPRAEQVELVSRMHEVASGSASRLRTETRSIAQALERAGNRFPGTVARFGADLYTYSAQWLGELQRELEEGGESD